MCREPATNTVVACYDDKLGYYNGVGCYFKFVDPQPPPTDPVWRGAQPGTGAVYFATCYVIVGGVLQLQSMGPTWQLNPPNVVFTPGQVAQMAAAKLTMHGPTIGTQPSTEGTGLVGLPVWLWTAQTPQTWGTQKATAAVPGLSVTATATATAITWDMGDGHQVTCDKPGRPYDPAKDSISTNPDCGYVYSKPSGDQTGGKYTITGTTTWQITWVASTGETGSLPPMQLSSTTTVKIGEMQAVNH